MASPGVNLAVTKDGGVYNKLQRPDNYLVPTTARLPPLAAAVPPTPYTSKRKRGQDDVPGGKRARAEDKFAQTKSGSTGRECGMRTMLPGANEEEQLSDDSTSEALAYLRSVRSEASMIPPLLVAPTGDRGDDENDVHSAYSDASDRHRLVYKDGIWIALDNNYDTTHDEDEWDEDYCNPDPQETCYNQLLKRFQSLRHQILKADTSSSIQNAVEASEKSHNTQPPRNKRAWLQTIDRDYPTLAQVLQIDERNLYFGLQICASSLSQSTLISREKCCWIWSLLASAGDIGTLDHERISKIRDLGLQVGRLSVRLRENSVCHQRSDDENAVAGQSRVREEDSPRDDGEGAIEDSEETKPGMATDLPQDGEIGEVDGVDCFLPELGNEVRHRGSLKGNTSESEAEMSMSENEDQSHDDAGTKDLEQARERLLAQLGDRLVQPRVPSSRVEAERQRQQMRGHKSHKETTAHAHTDGGVPRDAKVESFALTDAEWNTRVAIDMILTVVVECYGQKDLVEFREAW
ncbi:uncharacterized protein K460DRAFT_318378 [Cucurbitaria berberidis CBS 394.84]|uniref:Uncharacterized protein n=1 Tax=Cucurbitaria berberidis CBS 394.84 TaxID=1168544 RepID=A0A9P4GA02_9PLEO|nr:uncharacterized protein K460DRAFT_318378 [Cucurbitaria berberidis CBS 394.84]KAF1841434.1 hypothetical protein K460DRAFT_318378 [Cucurbitaria berberidis CBS 394.84]